jgi:hypothetical protein
MNAGKIIVNIPVTAKEQSFQQGFQNIRPNAAAATD